MNSNNDTPSLVRLPWSKKDAQTLVVFDVETTELIGRNQDPRSLRVSLLCAQKLDLVQTALKAEPVVLEEIVIWVGKGHTLDTFFTWLDEATVIVAHHGLGFDMPVLRMLYDGKYNASRYVQHCAKVFDTLLFLRESKARGSLALGNLLLYNGDKKLGNGKLAPEMWRDEQRHADLLEYCFQDVRGLARLVAKPRIKLQNDGSTTSAISANRLVHAYASTHGNGTEFFRQGSSEWYKAREGKLTASYASIFLGITEGEEFPDSDSQRRMRVGRVLEPIVRSLYANSFGTLVTETGLHIHDEYSFIGASPDGIVENGSKDHPYDITNATVLLEIKTGMESKPYLTDAHLVQGILQIACTGAQFVDFVLANASTLEFDVVRLERDKNTEKVIIERCLKYKRDDDGDVQMREESYARTAYWDRQELQTALKNTRDEYLFDVTHHKPSFGGHEAHLLYSQY